MSKQCPQCYRAIDDDLAECPYCSLEVVKPIDRGKHNMLPSYMRMNCPSCGESIPGSAITCPYCAQPITESVSNKQMIRIFSPVHILCFVLAALIVLIWLIFVLKLHSSS